MALAYHLGGTVEISVTNFLPYDHEWVEEQCHLTLEATGESLTAAGGLIDCGSYGTAAELVAVLDLDMYSDGFPSPNQAILAAQLVREGKSSLASFERARSLLAEADSHLNAAFMLIGGYQYRHPSIDRRFAPSVRRLEARCNSLCAELLNNAETLELYLLRVVSRRSKLFRRCAKLVLQLTRHHTRHA